ncbi:hypothetical protein BH23ACT9_BH23ACT9_09450 [soil metagenome]
MHVRPQRSHRLLILGVCVSLIATLAVSRATADVPGGPVDGIQQAYEAVRVPEGSTGTPANTAAEYEGEPLTVQVVDVGRESAEPTIGVTSGGAIFYAAGAFDAFGLGFLARTEILRSTDDGLTWEKVTAKLPVGIEPDGQTTLPPTTLDPYVYVDEDTGRVFQPELYGGCTFLNFSDDDGETWFSNPVACGDFVNDHQTIWTGPPPPGLPTIGYPNVLYYCFNRVIDANCGRSLDGGLTFIPTATPAFLGFDPLAGGLCGGLHGHIKVDGDGRLFLPKGHCGRPWVAVSEDGGDTWTRVRVSGHVGSAVTHTALDVDDAGNVYYTWIGASDRLPYLAVSTDHGRTWGDPLMIAPPGVHEVNFPVLTAGAEGRIAVMFPGGTSTDRTDNRRPWNSYHVVSTNALDETPLFISTTANPEEDPIHRGNCLGRCAGMFDFLDIVTSPADGTFWSAVTDTCTSRSGCNEASSPGAANDARGLAVRQLSGPLLRPDAAVADPPEEGMVESLTR